MAELRRSEPAFSRKGSLEDTATKLARYTELYMNVRPLLLL